MEIAVRFSVADLNDQGVTSGRLRDLTAAFNWNVTSNYRTMLNVIWADLKGADAASIAQIRL